MSKTSEIRQLLTKGRLKEIIALTKECLNEGVKPTDILNEGLLAGMDDIAKKWAEGRAFIPEVLIGARCMNAALDVLEPHLVKEDTTHRGTVVFGTVKGDQHDIGKNLVALMLKNYGYRVIDLGKDVSKEEIIETAAKEKADVIALSALMTTTMQEMKNVIEYAKENGVTAKVIIGGAVITQDYADEIGADGYSKDAADAVKLVKRLLGV